MSQSQSARALRRSQDVFGTPPLNSIAVTETLAQTTGNAHASSGAPWESQLAVEELGPMLNFIADEKVK